VVIPDPPAGIETWRKLILLVSKKVSKANWLRVAEQFAKRKTLNLDILKDIEFPLKLPDRMLDGEEKEAGIYGVSEWHAPELNQLKKNLKSLDFIYLIAMRSMIDVKSVMEDYTAYYINK
jgi:hypothetical protein